MLNFGPKDLRLTTSQRLDLYTYTHLTYSKNLEKGNRNLPIKQGQL